VADELLNRQMSAEHINALVKHGLTVFEETLRRNLKNFLQDGYLPFTKPLRGEERRTFLLSPAAPQQAVDMMSSQETAVRGQGVELMEEIVEARQSNGQEA
jgi:hypothetical protein